MFLALHRRFNLLLPSIRLSTQLEVIMSEEQPSKPLVRPLPDSPAARESAGKRPRLDMDEEALLNEDSTISQPAPSSLTEADTNDTSNTAPTSRFAVPPSTLKFCNTDGKVGEIGPDGQYHLRETDVGISQYMGPKESSFQGIVKQRFEDFMVYEVDTEGQVVHLKDITVPVDPFNQPKQKKPEPEADASIETPEASNGTTGTAGQTKQEPEEEQVEDDTPQDDGSDLSEALRFPPLSQWNHATTRKLVDLLPESSIVSLYELLKQGRNPPKVAAPPESERPTDNGWGGMKRKDHAKDEEEAMNDETRGSTDHGQVKEPPQQESSFVPARGQGRDRGRGRGGRGGFGGGRPEKPKDTRQVLSEASHDPSHLRSSDLLV